MKMIRQVLQKAIQISRDSKESEAVRKAAHEVVVTIEDFPPNSSLDADGYRKAFSDIQSVLPPSKLGL
jgi:predicted Zn-dependent protease with MMP-like domain